MEHFFKAAGYSRDGFLTLLGETAFRQELVFICAALVLLWVLRGRGAATAAAPWGLIVLTAEALNTAVEKTVDLVTRERCPLAKQAKDTASFACAAAIAAFVIACIGEL